MKRSLAFGVMFLLLVTASKLGAAITCSEAVTTLLPCLPYLVGSPDVQPTAACCIAVKSVNDQASTREVRRDLCKCFQSAAKSFPVDPDKAKAIPDLCHVQVPVPIDPTIDCNSIKL
ncbi:hypothetical protein K2173_002699 [Erythroxylum novogranatense]|uniref:Bifunctional inhibitor/plant lipid transfer protein/seed storage helical domain-containing protein n=1 Tax=Erythroxylum novogranatense TaxID=1862640 RepID=A0AAV8SWU4_9ROSI|nr:hypothetical protein K2173_002699 [Erythroxylum novogranatense]